MACYSQQEIARAVGYSADAIGQFLKSLRDPINGTGAVYRVSSENSALANQRDFDEDSEDDDPNSLGVYQLDKRLLVKANHVDENYRPPIYNVWKQQVKTAGARHHQGTASACHSRRAMACYSQQEIAKTVGYSERSVRELLDSIRNGENGTGAVSPVSSENSALANHQDFDEDSEDDDPNSLGVYQLDKRLLVKANHVDENYRPPIYNVWKQQVKTAGARHHQGTASACHSRRAMACYSQQEIANQVGYDRSVISKFLDSLQDVRNGASAVSHTSSENPPLANPADFDEGDEDDDPNSLGVYKLDSRLLVKANHVDENYRPPIYNVWKQQVKTAGARHHQGTASACHSRRAMACYVERMAPAVFAADQKLAEFNLLVSRQRR